MFLERIKKNYFTIFNSYILNECSIKIINVIPKKFKPFLIFTFDRVLLIYNIDKYEGKIIYLNPKFEKYVRTLHMQTLHTSSVALHQLTILLAIISVKCCSVLSVKCCSVLSVKCCSVLSVKCCSVLSVKCCSVLSVKCCSVLSVKSKVKICRIQSFENQHLKN